MSFPGLRTTALSAGVVSAMLIACPASPGTDPEPDPSPTPLLGGTVTAMAVEDLDALDPHLAARPSSWFVARALHRGLLTFPPTTSAEPMPDLGRMTSNSTSSLYRFRLSGGQRFSDGEPIRSRDVKASLERLIAAGRGVARWLDVIEGTGRFLSGRAGDIEGIRTEGARGVVIELSAPTTDLPWILAHPQVAILPASTPGPGIDPRTIIGAGPYRIRRYDPERRLVIERASRAGVHVATFDRLEVTIGGSTSDGFERVRAADADLLLEAGPLDEARAHLRPGDGPSCTRFVFSSLEPPSPEMAAAVGRARDALGDLGAPAGSLLPPGVIGHVPASAREGTVPTVADRRSLTMVVGTSDAERAEAEAVAAELEAAGFEVQVEHVRSDRLPSRYADPTTRPAMGIATWCPDWPGDAARNVLGALPIARELARAVRAAASDGSAARWARVERRVASSGVIPLVYVPLAPVVSERLAGPIASAILPQGDPFALWLAR